MNHNVVLDYIIKKGNESETFGLKTFLYENGITSNLSSNDAFDFIEEVILLGTKLGYLKRPTKELYVSLTEKGVLAKSCGGSIKFEKLEKEKENKLIYKEDLELKKLKAELEATKLRLKDYQITKALSWIGSFIAILLAIVKLIEWISQSN